MSKVKVNLAEKRLLEHLRLGGSTSDEVGRTLVWKFAQTAWGQPEIKPIVTQYGLTIQEVAALYSFVIDSLMPNPCVEAGGLLLVPTLFFMEPHRIENLLLEVWRDTPNRSHGERLEFLSERAVALALLTQEAHDEARGRADFNIENRGGSRSGGCMAPAAGVVTTMLGLLFSACS